MFALDCIKNNGTHLGTCIDRFYFGSCCDLSNNSHKNSGEKWATKWTTAKTTTTKAPITEQTTRTTTATTTTAAGVTPELATEDNYVTSSTESATVLISEEPTSEAVTHFDDNFISTTEIADENQEEKVGDVTEYTVKVEQTIITMPSTTTAATTTTTVPTTTTTEATTTTATTTTSAATTTPETTTTTATTTTPETTTTTATTTTTPATETVVPATPATVEPFVPANVADMDYLSACGRQLYKKEATGRIVNGHKSSFGEWPWQISLRQWKRTTFMHKCGAALLNDNWAITAAHCVDGVPPEDLLLRIGEFDLSSTSESLSHVERRVQIMTTHPDFNPRTFENDLALLRFYEPIAFRENIIPICLPSSNDTFVNKTGYVTGWGRLYVDGPLPNILQEVQVPVITNSECEQEYRKAGFLESIPNIFLCAGYVDGGRDSCEGDSGGPLVIKQSNGRWVLAGIISWGIGCAEPHQPGVYTRISHFKDWINRILVF